MRLRSKRVLIPAALGALALALLAVLWLRGTLADREARRPSSSAEGILAQLWIAPSGRPVVRCAAVLDHPVDRVWAVVTDYPRFAEIFPTVANPSSAVEPDGRHRLRADVSSWIGTWPVDVRIRHEASAGRRVASWNEPTGSVVRNDGSWTLSAIDDRRTLVEYVLDVEIAGCPDWLVRAVLRSRQKGVLAALGQAVDRRP